MDTTKLGAILGTIGAAAGIIPGVLARRVFMIARVIFLDYAAVLTLGHKVNNIWDWIIAVIGHLIFGAFLGIVFAFFIKNTSSESSILKGGGFGAFIWLLTLALATFFKISHFRVTHPFDCFFILIDAVCYGVVLALSYRYIFNKRKYWR